MVQAAPPDWRDTCEHCGRAFGSSESRWLEQRSYFVHTKCARWELWQKPPYVWKLKELRKRYRVASAAERVRIARAGRAIREMEEVWPHNAAENVDRVLAAVREVP